jgi:hypothetical protein
MIPRRVLSAKTMYKNIFLILVILAIALFLAIGFSFNDAHAQEKVSGTEATMGGVSGFDVSKSNILCNFSELH